MINKKIFSLIFIVAIWLVLGTCVNAASLSIRTNKSSVSPGEAVTVTVTLSNGAGKITSGGQTFWLDNSSYSYNVTAGSSGSVSLSASGVVADYSTEQDQSVSASASVKINTPVATPVPATPTPAPNTGNTGNTNNNNNTTVSAPVLSNLGITPHDFSGFSANKTSYTVNVPNDCAAVNLYASSKNGTVSGTGNKSLKEGTNKFSVTVTNNAGSKTYTVSIVRATSSGVDVPNVIEDATAEEQPIESIGLSNLEILGYKLDKDFKTDEYSYTIKVSDEITRYLFRRIKRKNYSYF